MCWRNLRVNFSPAHIDDHIPVPSFICVEMYGYIWMTLDMLHFVCVRLAKDQKRVLIPDKPDGSRLRNEVRSNGG